MNTKHEFASIYNTHETVNLVTLLNSRGHVAHRKQKIINRIHCLKRVNEK